MAKNNRNNNKDIFSLEGLSFLAVMLLGLSLLIVFILQQINVSFSVVQWIERIALAVAMLIPVCLSYRWAKGTKNWIFVLWIIAVVLVVVFYILNLIL